MVISAGLLTTLLFVCALFLSLRELGIDVELNTMIGFGIGFTLRLLAIWRGGRLPNFSYQR